jgi:hypothetical protein
MKRAPACLECRESSTGRCARHRAPLPPEFGEEPDVYGGQFYAHEPGGKFVPIGETAPPGRQPDAWICRRVVDYPGERVPDGGDVTPCSRCAAPVVFNPKREVQAPKVCFQCARITPLPMES